MSPTFVAHIILKSEQLNMCAFALHENNIMTLSLLLQHAERAIPEAKINGLQHR